MKRIVKIFSTFFALLAAGFAAQATVGIVSGPIHNPATGHDYFIVGPGTWSQAEAFAQTLGGHLVTINDAAEDAWVTANFLTPNPTINPWMGLHDADANGTWEWASGEPVTYLNWAAGEPNFPHELHSNLYPANHPWAGQWNNAPDSEASGVIYGIVEVPEPSVLAVSCLGFAFARSRRFTSKA